MFSLTIDTDNAAFAAAGMDSPAFKEGIAQALIQAAEQVTTLQPGAGMHVAFWLTDADDERVGQWQLSHYHNVSTRFIVGKRKISVNCIMR